MKFCCQCGEQLPSDESVVCVKCGAAQQPGAELYRGNVNNEVSVGNWVLRMLLMAIPIVNIIMLFVWGFGSETNATAKNWAKAQLIWLLIGVGISVVVGIFAAMIGVMSVASMGGFSY